MVLSPNELIRNIFFFLVCCCLVTQIQWIRGSMASSLSTSTSLQNASQQLSCSLFPSAINLSSNSNVSLPFYDNKVKPSPLLSSTPRFLTVIAMAPPKLGGKAKAKKGTSIYLRPCPFIFCSVLICFYICLILLIFNFNICSLAGAEQWWV